MQHKNEKRKQYKKATAHALNLMHFFKIYNVINATRK